MKKPNLEKLENEIIKKYSKKDKKGKTKMKVSGAGVKNIQKILLNKK